MDNIIIASNKEWNKKIFRDKYKKFNQKIKYVENQKELIKILRASKTKYIFFIHWHSIVPNNIINNYDCICFHMTDLPYGRGGSPLQNLILRGHTKTKLSAIKMNNKIDAGPVYYKTSLSLKGSAEEIYLRCSKLCFKIIDRIISKNPLPIEQKGKIVKFKRRKPNQSKIPNKLNLQNIYDYIRMLDAPGYPKAYINIGKYKVELTNAKFRNGKLTFIGSIENSK